MLRYATFSFNDNITVLFSTASSMGAGYAEEQKSCPLMRYGTWEEDRTGKDMAATSRNRERGRLMGKE